MEVNQSSMLAQVSTYAVQLACEIALLLKGCVLYRLEVDEQKLNTLYLPKRVFLRKNIYLQPIEHRQ